MKITYNDYHPRSKSDYQGTEIIIIADDKKEARKIDVILTVNRKEIFSDWAYGYKRKKLRFRFVGYDGFLASLIEAILTGERKSYLHKHRVCKLKEDGSITANSVLKEERRAREERLLNNELSYMA